MNPASRLFPKATIVTDSAILNYRYAYNDKGLMVSRSESVIDRLEKLTYDNLDRLTQVKSGKIGQTGTTKAFSYENNGNIEQYGTGFYSYQSNDKPHAARQITPSSNVSPQTVNYNFFNQPTKITEGENKIYLYYGANQQRNKVVKNINSQENIQYYINKYYEIEDKEEDTENIQHYHYIYGDNGVVALDIGLAPRDYIITPNDSIMLNDTTISGGTPHRIISSHSLYYLHPDHLGSYCVLTDAGKNVVQNNRFDPWGNNVGTANFALISRGFTGHEHYPQFKIINMNARLYDPVIGRFFSPDKYVANSSFTQDFNRYTYARNNPLMYTDPSGEFLWVVPILGAMVGAFMNVAMNTSKIDNVGQIFAYMGIGALSGFAGGCAGAGVAGVLGVSSAIGFSAGFGAGFASGFAGGFTGAFITGTGNTWLQGGNFWQGIGNGISSGITSGMISGLTAGIAGGIQAGMYAKAHGGKF